MITRRWALDRGAEVQTCTSDSVAFNMFLHFDLKTIPLVGYPKIYQNIYIYIYIYIYIPSLNTLGSFVFELNSGQINYGLRRKNPTHCHANQYIVIIVFFI